MNRWALSVKWEVIMHMFAASVLMVGTGALAFLYVPPDDWTPTFIAGLIAVLLLIGLSVGYYSVQRLQRRLDALHLGLIQVAKGNLKGRIEFSGVDSFARIYQDFNEMAESLEEKIKLLQKLGEENVLLQTASNEAAVLEERKRLARDLHDTVSQQLFAIHMSASTLPKVFETSPGKAKDVMQNLIVMSNSAQKQMRSLIAQLRPLELEGKTLAAALEKWFPDYCRQNDLQGALDIRIGEPMSEAAEHQLFLIIQEAMANVVKHAAARHVTLELHDAPHRWSLTIADDGRGFDPAVAEGRSYGLSTMRERAQRLGGDAEILSKPGAGSRIQIHIPKFGSEPEHENHDR